MENEDDQKEFKYVNEQIVEPSKFKKILKWAGFIFMCLLIPMGVGIGVLWGQGKVPSGDELDKDTNYITIPKDTTCTIVEGDTTTKQPTGEKTELTRKELRRLANETGKAFVTIVTYKSKDIEIGQEPDGITSGVIIKKGINILLLTEYKTVKDAGKIDVIFKDEKVYSGKFKKGDPISGTAIIALPSSILEEGTSKLIEEVSLGNSMAVTKGTQIIYLGNPIDSNIYEDYGMVTSEGNQMIVDAQLDILYTNISASGNANGFLIDITGQVVGIINNINGSKQKVLSFIGISDLKAIIEKLTNNIGIPYLGIKGENITDDVIEKYNKNMPYGVFVTSVIDASPAYKSVIKPGDIIDEINGESIRNIDNINNVLVELQAGDEITVEVKRDERNGYKPYKLQVVLEER